MYEINKETIYTFCTIQVVFKIIFSHLKNKIIIIQKISRHDC